MVAKAAVVRAVAKAAVAKAVAVAVKAHVKAVVKAVAERAERSVNRRRHCILKVCFEGEECMGSGI